MEIERLKTFLNVVQYGSFQQAAQKMYLSQRAVSKQMTMMEDELGVRLFERGQNSISLTTQGHLFYASAQDIVNNYTNVLAEIQRAKATEQQRLRVGYFSAFEQRLLQSVLYELLDQDQHLQLTVTEGSNEHLIHAVVDRTLDVALSISYGHPVMIENPAVTAVPIFTGTMVMGISKLNPLSRQKSLAGADIGELPILYYSPENSTFLRESFVSSVPQLANDKKVHRVTSVEQMNLLVSLNKAVAFYPSGLLPAPLDSHMTFVPWAEAAGQRYTIDAVVNTTNQNPLVPHVLEALRHVDR
ncbi:LysR family transcriptional regulator [Furfurilactobacillus sp. WILCCON 0119]